MRGSEREDARVERLLHRLGRCVPEFLQYWKEERDLWTDEDGRAGAHAIMAVFSHLISERLSNRRLIGMKAVFDLAEELMRDPDDEIPNAVATCFLENIMNRVPESISPETFVDLLGPESRKFCRAWDRFCGMTTPGL
ncbi:MAG: hypothetical protein JXR96_16990 [Deltaproteobacteria bacterium]|nr:hypothetical protein [Deltaproteobacteria bacterium]